MGNQPRKLTSSDGNDKKDAEKREAEEPLGWCARLRNWAGAIYDRVTNAVQEYITRISSRMIMRALPVLEFFVVALSSLLPEIEVPVSLGGYTTTIRVPSILAASVSMFFVGLRQQALEYGENCRNQNGDKLEFDW